MSPTEIECSTFESPDHAGDIEARLNYLKQQYDLDPEGVLKVVRKFLVDPRVVAAAATTTIPPGSSLAFEAEIKPHQQSIFDWLR